MDFKVRGRCVDWQAVLTVFVKNVLFELPIPRTKLEGVDVERSDEANLLYDLVYHVTTKLRKPIFDSPLAGMYPLLDSRTEVHERRVSLTAAEWTKNGRWPGFPPGDVVRGPTSAWAFCAVRNPGSPRTKIETMHM